VRLGRGEAVSWRPYDWDAEDGRFGAPITAGPAAVVLLNGAYSARPELAPLLGLRVLLDAPRDRRRERLLRREGERDRAEWEARWGEARQACSASTSAKVRANVRTSPGQRADT